MSSETSEMTDSCKPELEKLEKMEHLEAEVRDIRNDVAALKDTMLKLSQQLSGLQSTLENVTNQNILLIAEEFSGLAKKINPSLSAAGHHIANEIKVNYLMNDVQNLKKDVGEVKAKLPTIYPL